MELEIKEYLVEDVVEGPTPGLEGTTLVVNVEELERIIKEDSRVASASVEIAYPGTSTRIWPVRDIIEPRIKTKGGGTSYPGICGRPIKGVGNGSTNKLSGVCVVEVSEVPWHEAGGDHLQLFLDMSGPWADLIPYSKLINICVIVEPVEDIPINEKNRVVHEACLKISDALAALTVGNSPTRTETFALTPTDSDLPKVAYIQCVHSSQATSGNMLLDGAADTFCTSIYGHTELTPAIALHPNELMDGAISGPYRTAFATSWMLVNNPILQELYELHGLEIDFVGCIAMRTEWTTQREKDLISEQTARLAKLLRAEGVIVTWDAGGNEEVEVVQMIRECEDIGIKAVWLTSDDHVPANGESTLLTPLPELDAIVSTGCFRGGDLGFETVPAVDRVVGSKKKLVGRLRDREVETSSAIAPPAMFDDHYGIMNQTCKEF